MSAAAETTVPRSTVAAAPFGMSWLLAATATAGVAVAPTRLLACFAVGTAKELQDNPESDDCAAPPTNPGLRREYGGARPATGGWRGASPAAAQSKFPAVAGP